MFSSSRKSITVTDHLGPNRRRRKPGQQSSRYSDWLTIWTIRGSIPVRNKRFICSVKYPDQLWCPQRLLSRYWVLFPRCETVEAWHSDHPCLQQDPRLKTSRAVHQQVSRIKTIRPVRPPTLYASMVCTVLLGEKETYLSRSSINAWFYSHKMCGNV